MSALLDLRLVGALTLEYSPHGLASMASVMANRTRETT